LATAITVLPEAQLAPLAKAYAKEIARRRRATLVMAVVVVVLIVLVQGVQSFGDRLSRRLNKRLRHSS